VPIIKLPFPSHAITGYCARRSAKSSFLTSGATAINLSLSPVATYRVPSPTKAMSPNVVRLGSKTRFMRKSKRINLSSPKSPHQPSFAIERNRCAERRSIRTPSPLYSFAPPDFTYILFRRLPAPSPISQCPVLDVVLLLSCVTHQYMSSRIAWHTKVLPCCRTKHLLNTMFVLHY